MAGPLDRLQTALAERYAVDREIGRGGMAVVYLAHDHKLGRDVALKVLRPELASSLGPDRFLREIEIAAKLTHPNILGVHDCGEADGLLYYVMPYVEGESLRERLEREGKIPVPEAVRLTDEIAAALSYAHERGVIHRDIKPENIILSGGRAVVADFGIARAVQVAGSQKLTETGLAVGTPAYMSPEQAMGVAEVDARSDVYALGCVLYEMVTGVTPFEGKTPQEVVAKHAVDTAPSMRRRDPAIPVFLERAVERALAKSPEERFPSSGAFAEVLTRGLVVARVGKRRRQQRIRGAAITGAVLLAAAAWALATAPGGPAYRRIAVLPPTNLMNDPDQAFFLQGIHTALISELQRAGMVVIARTSVLQYENTQKSIRDIAREQDLDAVVEASVRRAGDSLEVQLGLVDGHTQQYLGEPIVQRSSLREVERLYRTLTAAVAAGMGQELTQEAQARLANAREVDPDAYQDYLRGMFHVTRLMPGDMDAALGYFQRALERDSTYAPAYAGIAWVWLGRAQGFAQGGFESIREAQLKARAAVQKAWTLDSTLVEVQTIAASARAFHEWDWTGAEEAYRKALQTNPNDPTTRAVYSHFLYVTGRPREGRAEIDRAVALDPADGFCAGFNGMAYSFEGRYDEAVAELRRALDLGNGAGMNLVDILYRQGQRAEALAALREFYAGDQELLDAVDQGYAEGGYPGALRGGADVWASRPNSIMGSTFLASMWYALAEDRERALEFLERAYEEHDPNMPYIDILADFDLVRDDPRFRSLARRVGLPE